MSAQSVEMFDELLTRAYEGLKSGAIKRIVVSDLTQMTDYWFQALLDAAADDQCQVTLAIQNEDLHIYMKGDEES